MTITTEQIPDGWHRNMPEEVVNDKLLNYIRDHIHMDFVLPLLRKSTAESVDWLVNAACNHTEPPRNVIKFLQMISRIEGSVTQAHMHRLSRIEARKDPAVDSLISSILALNGYALPMDPIIEGFAFNALKMIQNLSRKKSRKRG